MRYISGFSCICTNCFNQKRTTLHAEKHRRAFLSVLPGIMGEFQQGRAPGTSPGHRAGTQNHSWTSLFTASNKTRESEKTRTPPRSRTRPIHLAASPVSRTHQTNKQTRSVGKRLRSGRPADRDRVQARVSLAARERFSAGRLVEKSIA